MHLRSVIRFGHLNTPLHLTAAYGYYEIVELFIKSGAKVESKNVDKDTPMHLVAGSNCNDVRKLLLDNEASPTAKSLSRCLSSAVKILTNATETGRQHCRRLFGKIKHLGSFFTSRVFDSTK